MPGRPWRVLIVDEPSETRGAIAQALRSAGAAVDEAGSAQVALLSLEREKFDQMLTALVLPDADGYALLNAVRQLKNGSGSLRAVALCADTDPQETKLQAILGGFHLVMTTPCTPESVALTLRGMARLDQHPPAAAPVPPAPA